MSTVTPVSPYASDELLRLAPQYRLEVTFHTHRNVQQSFSFRVRGRPKHCYIAGRTANADEMAYRFMRDMHRHGYVPQRAVGESRTGAARRLRELCAARGWEYECVLRDESYDERIAYVLAHDIDGSPVASWSFYGASDEAAAHEALYWLSGQGYLPADVKDRWPL